MLYYRYVDPIGNVGDDLNAWLWPKLLNAPSSWCDNTMLLGVGTLLNTRLPALPLKVVFGAGVGYGDPPVLDATYRVRFVRGFDSAALLNLPRSKVITDAAYLVRELHAAGAGGGRPAFMPHHISADYADWVGICADAGIDYIDPRQSVPVVLEAIGNARAVIVEAMHGAILADALRVPWVPVSIYPHIVAFKWSDWLSTIGLSYEPVVLPVVYDQSQARKAAGVRRKLRAAWRIGSTNFAMHRVPSARTTPAVRDAMTMLLRSIGENSADHRLSDDVVASDLQLRLSEALFALQRDYKALCNEGRALAHGRPLWRRRIVLPTHGQR